MAQLSDYAEVYLLNLLLRDPDTTIYFAFHTANPTEDATGAEVTGGSYERQIIEFDELFTNSNQILFSGMPTTTITHIALWDELTGGNMLMYNSITNIVLNTNDEINIDIGAIEVSLD